MIVDNGEQRRLYIEGVFEGDAGVSRGVVAFRPTAGQKPKANEAGVLGGQIVTLSDIALSDDGQVYTGHYRVWGDA